MCAPSRAPRAAQARRRRAEPCAASASATAGPRAGCCCRAHASGSRVTATATRRRAAQQVSASRRAGTRARPTVLLGVVPARSRSGSGGASAQTRGSRSDQPHSTVRARLGACRAVCAPNPPSAGRSATYTPPTWTGAVKAERERAGGRRRATHLAAAAARLRYTLHLVSQARSDGGFKRVRPSASLLPPLASPPGWLRDCGLVSRPHFPRRQWFYRWS